MSKGKIGGIIAAIVVIALAAGGFAGYWFNRPIYKVNKAIEENNIESVAGYYNKLNEADKDEVSTQMRVHC